jgi:transcription initiation factor IIE alpha subunit
MAKQNHGIVARITTAPNKIPKYWGYDLRRAHPDIEIKRDLTIADFNLIFQGMSQDKATSFNPEVVLQNIDKTIFTLYQQEVDLGEKFEEECKKVENRVVDVQGQIIKEVIDVDGKQQVKLAGEHTPEVAVIMNNMFNCWANARIKRMELVEKLTEAYRVGTLDIKVTGDNERLVVRTKNDGSEEIAGPVSLKQLKETLFFVCDIYKTTKEFQDKINLVYEESGYICEIEKNKFSFDKEEPFTDTEIAIAKDLLKLNRMLGG